MRKPFGDPVVSAKEIRIYLFVHSKAGTKNIKQQDTAQGRNSTSNSKSFPDT